MIRGSLELPGGGASPDEAWAELLAGNQRLRDGTPDYPRRSRDAREAVVSGQRPIAAVLGCSDSRVPLEIVFDQGYGDIFAVRTIGPTLSISSIGSVEYAVVELEVPLLVVVTHHMCGALATARHIATSGLHEYADLPGMLPELVAGIRRSTSLMEPAHAPTQHARDVVEGITERSAPVREAAAAGRLRVVGAVYDIESGEVHQVI